MMIIIVILIIPLIIFSIIFMNQILIWLIIKENQLKQIKKRLWNEYNKLNK